MKKIISGPGLTNPGVVILQFALLFFSILLESLFKDSLGLITGISIWIAFFGGIYLGRTGTSFAVAVAPPISLAGATILFSTIRNLTDFSISKLIIDTVAALASTAPFLISGAVVAWYFHLKINPKKSLSGGAQVLS